MDIRRHVETTAAGLAREAKPERREVLVDLLLQWLQDGRTTPTHLAQALTKVIGTTEKGLTYLDQALASLSTAGEAGQATVLLSLEQTFAGSVEAFPSKKLSTLLDRLSGLLQEMRRVK